MYQAKGVVDKVTKGGKTRIALRREGISGSIYFNKDSAPDSINIEFCEVGTEGHQEVCDKIAMERAAWS